MSPLISVIVPVYNAEKSLDVSVGSILAQTHRTLEVILVDDGSLDGSGAICDALAMRDERIRVIHKENGGVSSARNAGLDAASGDYIAFVDGDDTIDVNMYEVLLATIQECGAELAVCGYQWHKGPTRREVHVPLEGHFSVPRLYEMYLSDFVAWASLMTSIWNKLFSAQLIQSALDPIRFAVDLHRSEDALFVVDCLAAATGEVVFIDTCPYHYDLAGNAGSLTKTVDFLTLETPMKTLRKNMLTTLPQRHASVDRVFAGQMALMTVWATLDDIKTGRPTTKGVTRLTVRTVVKNCDKTAEKLIALFVYAFPRRVVKFATRFL